MHRITISVTSEIEQALRREARRQGCSISAVARESLSSHLHLVVSADAPRRNLSFIGIGASGQPGIADQIDEILDREWTWERLALGEDSAGDS